LRGRQEVRDSAEVMAACKTAMETAFWCVRSLAPSQRRRSRAVEAFIGVTRADMSSTVKREGGGEKRRLYNGERRSGCP
jgi:hypothetical protein